MRSKLAAALAVASLAVASPAGLAAAYAQTPPIPPINPILTRQAGYALMGGVAEAMKQGVKDSADPKQFEDGASAMVDWGHVIPTMFPPGSDKGYDTKAKPAVWSDRAGFDKAAANFTEAATKLQTAAKSGDTAMFATQWKATAGTCGACHRNYKERE